MTSGGHSVSHMCPFFPILSATLRFPILISSHPEDCRNILGGFPTFSLFCLPDSFILTTALIGSLIDSETLLGSALAVRYLFKTSDWEFRLLCSHVCAFAGFCAFCHTNCTWDCPLTPSPNQLIFLCGNPMSPLG